MWLLENKQWRVIKWLEKKSVSKSANWSVVSWNLVSLVFTNAKAGSTYSFEFFASKFVFFVICIIRCKCKKTCLNRVVQLGLKWQLQVFKTTNKAGCSVNPWHSGKCLHLLVCWSNHDWSRSQPCKRCFNSFLNSCSFILIFNWLFVLVGRRSLWWPIFGRIGFHRIM